MDCMPHVLSAVRRSSSDQRKLDSSFECTPFKGLKGRKERKECPLSILLQIIHPPNFLSIVFIISNVATKGWEGNDREVRVTSLLKVFSSLCFRIIIHHTLLFLPFMSIFLGLWIFSWLLLWSTFLFWLSISPRRQKRMNFWTVKET